MNSTGAIVLGAVMLIIGVGLCMYSLEIADSAKSRVTKEDYYYRNTHYLIISSPTGTEVRNYTLDSMEQVFQASIEP